MAEGREIVEDTDASGGLLQREVVHVADEENELFLMVRPAVRFGGRLDDDDPGLRCRLLRERADAVGESIVRDVDPAAVCDVLGGGVCGRYLPEKDWGDGHETYSTPAAAERAAGLLVG